MRSHKRSYYAAAYCIVSVVLLTGFVICPSPCHATLIETFAPEQQATAAKNNPTVDVELSDTTLPAAIAMIQKQLKTVSIVLSSDHASRYRTVTLSVHGRPVDDVLHMIAASANADIWIEDGIYRFAPKGMHVPPKPDKLGQIRLNHANAETVREVLTGTWPDGHVDVGIAKDVIVNSIFADIGLLMTPGPVASGAASANPLLSHADGGLIGGVAQNGFAALPRVEPGDLTALSDNNTIIARYRDDAEGEAAFRELQTRARLLDIEPRKVRIRVRFVSVPQCDWDGIGINWQFQKVGLRGIVDPNYPASDYAIMRFASGKMETQLKFVLMSGRGKEVAAPLVTTFANVPAEFTSSAISYGFIPRTFIGPGSTAQATYKPVQMSETSSLTVTPTINSIGAITLGIRMQLLSEHDDGPGEQVLLQQSTPVTRTLRAGETLVIARLLRKHDLPVSDVSPSIKPLKLSDANAKASELLIFVTATILGDAKAGDAPPAVDGKPATTGATVGGQL